VKNAPRKPMVSAIIAVLILISPIYAESASNLEKYLDCSSEKKIDIAFVFDTTNSMGGEISELRATANKFATDLEASNIDYQLGLVEFRDFPETCDGFSCGSPGDFAYSVKGNGTLTAEIGTFSSWIKELKAEGGGSPGPEALLAALRHAGSDLTWRSDAEKAIIVLTDAGAHPDGSCCNAEGDTLEGTIFELVDIGARAYIIGPEDASLEKIAENTGGQFYEIRSGLSLKPLLEEITKSLGCSFKTDVATACENNQLEVSVQLIGKETIPYIIGQTEAWMYLDQAGSISRFNLSYDQEDEAYSGSVPDVCGPVELTVYGRAGERSAVQTRQVECGTCGGAETEALGEISISGHAFDDRNADGVHSADEAGLEGWEVLLTKPDGSSTAVRTDRNGYYIFTGLLPGNYRVAAQKENWSATMPSDGMLQVELVDVHEADKDLGFRAIGSNSWNKTFEVNQFASSSSVQQTSDGGYVITGNHNNGTRLIKTDTSGGILWERDYLGPLHGNSVRQTEDGGYIIAGERFLHEPWSTTDLWLIKTDANGDKLWERTFGGSNNDSAWEVSQTSDGGYIIAGTSYVGTAEASPTTYYSLGGFDILLIKTDSDGNEIWSRTFSESEEYEDHFACSVQQTSDGGYIIAGTKCLDHGYNSSVWLIKTDSNGDRQWDTAFGGNGRDSGNTVRKTNDGGYIIAGNNLSISPNSMTGWLIKTDSNGNELWNRIYESASCAQQTSDGGYIITGFKVVQREENRSDFYISLIKTDKDGNILWERSFGDFKKGGIGQYVQQTDDGGYIILGSQSEAFEGYNGISGTWLIKIDSEGN
jgi:hypothetical protein